MLPIMPLSRVLIVLAAFPERLRMSAGDLSQMHFIADIISGLAYFFIPALLVRALTRRRDIPFKGALVAFSCLLLLSAGTRFYSIWNRSHDDYFAEYLLELAVALVALMTVVYLLTRWKAMLATPSPPQLQAMNVELAARTADLERAQEQFNAFMRHSPMAAWITDDKGRYLYASPTNFEMFSVPLGSLIGRHVSDTLPQELADKYLSAIEHVISTKGARRSIEIATRPNGTHAKYIMQTFPLGAPDERLIVGGIAVDITEQMQTEESLLMQTDLLLAVTHAMEAYLLKGDWKGAGRDLLCAAMSHTGSKTGFLCVALDPTTVRILAHEGFSPSTATDKVAFDSLMASYEEKGYVDVARSDDLLGRCLNDEKISLINRPDSSRTGSLPPGFPSIEHFLAIPLSNETHVVGLIGLANREGNYEGTEPTVIVSLVQQAAVLCDSYRRQLRQTILEEQMRNSQKLESIGLLAGGVAHDFNNLLQVIQGYTTISQDPSLPPEERKSNLIEVGKAAHKAAQLTQQLLAFGRRQTLLKTDVDINRLIEELLMMLRRLIGDEIEVDFIPGHNVGNMRVDRGQIDQVLLNLCINARDAMATGGRITIETENVVVNGSFRESHPWAKPGRYVLLSVTDTGTGMDKATVERIFEPFFTTKPAGQGTGLGLSVVYGVIKQHDGLIHVYSEPGLGTTFKIYLPIFERGAALAGNKLAPAPIGGTETILVAEDESQVRLMAVKILQRAGYRVYAAVNGAEALEIFAEHHTEISLALLDVAMPKLGGLEVYAQIKNIKPDIRVIFSTGYAGKGESNVIDTHRILQKPYGVDTLLNAVSDDLKSLRNA